MIAPLYPVHPMYPYIRAREKNRCVSQTYVSETPRYTRYSGYSSDRVVHFWGTARSKYLQNIPKSPRAHI